MIWNGCMIQKKEFVLSNMLIDLQIVGWENRKVVLTWETRVQIRSFTIACKIECFDLLLSKWLIFPSNYCF